MGTISLGSFLQAVAKPVEVLAEKTKGWFGACSRQRRVKDGFADGDGVDPDGVVELCEALSFGLGVDGDAFPEVDGETASAEDVDEIEWEIEEEGDGEEDAVEQEEHGRVGRVCE